MQKKSPIKFCLTLLVAIGLFFILSSKEDKNANTGIIKVSRGNITEEVTAVGNISPQQSIAVKSPISGTVEKIFHNEGDFVRKNTPLLEIKPNPTPQDYAEIKQTVQIDLAQEQQDAADFSRYKSLLQKKAISPNDQDYNRAQSSYQKTHLKRILDEEKLALLDKGQAKIGDRDIDNIISSTTDGYILKRNVNMGDPVSAQTASQPGSELLIVADMRNPIFKGQVSETDIAKLNLNTPAVIKIAAFPEATVRGLLTKLGLQSTQADSSNININANQSNVNNNTSNANSPFSVGFNIEISHLIFPKNINPRSGYSATADIIISQAKNVLVIPARVLQFEGDSPYVLLGKRGSIKKQPIKTGLSDGMQVQVISGLNEGDKILESMPEVNQDK